MLSQRNIEVPKLLAAVAGADERSLKDVLVGSVKGWQFLLCESFNSEWALELDKVLDRVVQLGGLRQLVALQESGGDRRLFDLAPPKVKKAINKRLRTHSGSEFLCVWCACASTFFDAERCPQVPLLRPVQTSPQAGARQRNLPVEVCHLARG
jgi:hypothetical protein